jgi:hypothetical protein
MNNLPTRILLLLSLAVLCCSCKQKEVDGIVIYSTLYEIQNRTENRELRQLIHQTLNGDHQALSKLAQVNCGGAAGCYDLGAIITQIIYRMGEPEFSVMASKLNKEESRTIEGLIMAGLEYGDNNHDGKMDNEKIEQAFPELQQLLQSIGKQP